MSQVNESQAIEFDQWTNVFVEDILLERKGAIKIGPFGSQLKREYFVSEGIKVYGQENVYQDDFSIGDRRIDTEHYRQLQSCELFPGDVVISMMGTIGKCAIVPETSEKGIMDSHLLRMQIDTDKYNKILLMQLIGHSDLVKKQLYQLSVGGIMEGLSMGVVKKLVFPNPPLPEQKAIAEVLTTIDNVIEKTEQLIEKLKNMKKGLMQDLFTRGVLPDGSLRPARDEAPELYKESELGWIPKEWEVVQLSDIIKHDSPITYGVVQPGDEDDNGVQFVRGGDIFDGEISIGKLRRISTNISNQYQRTLLQTGDLLMSLVGYPGQVAIVPKELEGSNIARQAALIRLHVEYNKIFVMEYLLSEIGQDRLFNKSIGSAQQVINLIDLRTVFIVIPCRQEQDDIAYSILALRKRITQEEKSLLNIKNQKKGLMDDLLTGKVRVTELVEQ